LRVAAEPAGATGCVGLGARERRGSPPRAVRAEGGAGAGVEVGALGLASRAGADAASGLLSRSGVEPGVAAPGVGGVCAARARGARTAARSLVAGRPPGPEACALDSGPAGVWASAVPGTGLVPAAAPKSSASGPGCDDPRAPARRAPRACGPGQGRMPPRSPLPHLGPAAEPSRIGPAPRTRPARARALPPGPRPSPSDVGATAPTPRSAVAAGARRPAAEPRARAAACAGPAGSYSSGVLESGQAGSPVA
jgi:hypothetical protein